MPFLRCLFLLLFTFSVWQLVLPLQLSFDLIPLVDFLGQEFVQEDVHDVLPVEQQVLHHHLQQLKVLACVLLVDSQLHLVISIIDTLDIILDLFQAVLKQLLSYLVHVIPGYHGGCLRVSCLSGGVRFHLLFEGDLLH